MRKCTVKELEKALSELEVLRNATAVKGVNFGESYRETLDLAVGALEDKREKLLEEENENEYRKSIRNHL